MSESTSDQNVSRAQAFSFLPPAGGDVSLKSCDGTVFIVHSLLPRLASKVFSDMFASATSADVVELAEDAETISLMLAFIYPVMQPPLDTVAILEKAMLVAHKYEIDGLAKTLEHTYSQQRALIRQDPLRVFRSAKHYGFREMQTLAAKIASSSHYNMLTSQGLIELAKDYPDSAHVISLVGVQGARAHILMDISSQAQTTLWPMIPRIRGLLQPQISQKGLMGSCGRCIDQTFEMRTRFEKWSGRIYQFYEEQLAPLDVLLQHQQTFRVATLRFATIKPSYLIQVIPTLASANSLHQIQTMQPISTPSTGQKSIQIPFSFQPPPGGNVSLKSSDGTIFVVHSLLLSLASKVFSNMFVSTTAADVVELTEDAEAISLMLAFIYPVVRPSIDTISLLEKAMLMAHKYEINGLETTLEQSCNQRRALICTDPIRAFRMAADYGFAKLRR
ncbi:hypothetical protein FRC07_001493 [Ceratobasidium sp. 392]|nr:hypothetical protein FRC07_001493 [Ceratobasidium sp. 392]